MQNGKACIILVRGDKYTRVKLIYPRVIHILRVLLVARVASYVMNFNRRN